MRLHYSRLFGSLSEMPEFWSNAVGALAFFGAMAVSNARPESAAAAAELTFERDVRPILKTHCFHCHGEGDKLKGDVDLRLRRFMSKQTDSGTVMVPGRPKESLMVKMVRSGKMPTREKKLTTTEVDMIELWIAKGAKTT